MKTIVKNIFIRISLSFFLLMPNLVFAEPQASILLTPKNPSPNSSVKLTTSSYSFDVNTATITWRSGNTILLSGQGEKDLTIATGPVGSKSLITVTIQTSSGIQIEQSITITPESVTLIYESLESYTPLFYDGLALPSDQAVVRFTALPQISEEISGQMISPKRLSYSWYSNDTFIKDASGLGKQSANIPLDLLTESTKVRVVIRSEEGAVAEKTIDITPHRVMPILYDYDEIFGTNYSKPFGNRIEATKDFTLSLEPYFMSMNGSLLDTSSLEWTLNGFPVTPLGGRVLALHPKANTFGAKKLSISLSNSKRRVQKGELNTSILFDTR